MLDKILVWIWLPGISCDDRVAHWLNPNFSLNMR